MSVTSNTTLEDLMKLWKQKHISEGKERFISDGIVNAEEYGVDAPKICFFLKECYYTEEEYGNSTKILPHRSDKYISKNGNNYTYSLTENLKNEKPWVMWPKVKVITDTILSHLNNSISNSIQIISVLNIKKSNGNKSSNYRDIMNYAKADKEFIEKELSLLNPDIIVCGGVFDICRKFQLFLSREDIDCIYTFPKLCGIRAAYICGDKLILDMWHPTARRLSYQRLRDAWEGAWPELKEYIPFSTSK